MSRLTQMLANEQKRLGMTDREICEKHGWLQQSFSKWKRGTIPRLPVHEELAQFLGLRRDMLDELIEEAKTSTGNTKLPPLSMLDRVYEYGKVTDRKAGKFRFEPVNAGRKAIPEGRYIITVDTKVMEPALLVGTKAWLDPAVYPNIGDEVIVHARAGNAWLGQLSATKDDTATLVRHNGEPVTITDVQAVHVVVLSSRSASRSGGA